MKKRLMLLVMIAFMAISECFAGETAKIILLRPYDFGAAMGAVYGGKKYYSFHHYIDFDGQLFGNVATMQYYEIIVEPGNHTIVGYVGLQSPEDAKNEGQKYSLVIGAQAGKTYYACIDEKKMSIQLIDEKKWQKELKKNYPVQWVAKLELKGDVFYAADGTAVGENAPKVTTTENTQIADNAASPKEVIQSDVDQNIPQSNKKAEELELNILRLK